MVDSDPQGRNLDDLAHFTVTGEAGDFVFEEGDSGSDMFIIQEGEIEILKTWATEKHRLSVLEPGDFFGEMSLLEDQPREIAARALSDYTLLRIDHTTFDTMVQENPEIAVRMLRKMARWLRERQEQDLRAAQIAREVLGEEEEEKAAPPAVEPAEPTEGEMTAVAAVLVHQDSGEEFPLSQGEETTIGRVDRATGITPDIDFGILDDKRTLSRQHAKILRHEDGFYLREEIGTSNGTFLNGERIKTGVPLKVESGDEIRFGLVTTVLKCE